ncbi:Gfo/Idh/MocA family protein [Aureimonas sp. AU4]|uniref:Gfo/Idh/MocA family protein n=1 Tax=Aureimonas sp. AU4 TaxID=1638163 RepID=UPI0007810589|nr:Gfo/Idh/MocA family oxidoreductase [Aureimonas sp. AU4]
MVQRIGLVGCGVISDIYLTNAALFRDIRFTAVADARPEAAEARAKTYGLKALTLDELYESPDVDIVLNLTNPDAHAEVSLRALRAGKHVYGEKPLATTLEDGEAIMKLAEEKGLRVGSAPDTVLGAGTQTARRLMEDGTVGRTLSGVATIMSRGMEHWHPAPAFYFKPGGGPVLDMGPYYLSALVTLLGPIEQVVAMGQIGLAERTVTANGPNVGQVIPVTTPTTFHALLGFRSGAQVTLLASFDVWKHGMTPIELYGTGASIRVPDPNFFGGTIEIADNRDTWSPIEAGEERLTELNYPAASPRYANYRGLGLAEMAAAIEAGRPHRASGELALHVLEAMLGILQSAETGQPVRLRHDCRQPEALTPDDRRALLSNDQRDARRTAA